MKKILIPTDFSDCAQAAADLGLAIASLWKAEVYFLHLAVNTDELAHVPGKSVSHETGELGSLRFQLMEWVRRAEAKGIKAHALFVAGSGQERIEDFIKPYTIDLLVMGSHGATGIREAILGSKTQRVVRNLRVPSLIVKYASKELSPKSIIYVSNFKENESVALRSVQELAGLWKIPVHMGFINMFSHLIEENTARLLMSRQADQVPGGKFSFSVLDTNDPETAAIEFAGKVKAGVIAVGMGETTAIGRLFGPNLVEKLINHSTVPVFVAPY